MKNIPLKFIVLFLIIGLNWFGLLAIGNTWAYFNDTETSSTNIFTAGSLDFSIINTEIEELIGIELGEDIEFVSVVTKMTGSMDIQYKVHAEEISGNSAFCNEIQMEVSHSQISYDSDLISFDTSTTTAFGTWAFELKLPNTATSIPHGEECNVDLVFEGWRDDVADFNQSGFNDEERIHLRLTSRMIVLNEFLPYPDGIDYGFDFGNDSSNMPQGEWVELYNNSDIAFDLSDWYIKDDLESDVNKIIITASNTYPVTTVIDAKSWLVVYMNKAVLNNDGDTVRLFDDSDKLIDSYSYNSHDYCELQPTPGSDNGFTTGGGSCDSVPPNKSYARIPDGVGSWVDPIPTPGWMNILEDESLDSSPVAQNDEPAEEIVEPELVEEPVVEEEIVDTGSIIEDDFFEETVEEIKEIIKETEEVFEEMIAEEPAEEVVEPELVEEPVVEEEIVVEEESVIPASLVGEEEPAEEVVEPELVEEPVVEEEPIIEEVVIEEPIIEEVIEEPVVLPDDTPQDENNGEED